MVESPPLKTANIDRPTREAVWNESIDTNPYAPRGASQANPETVIEIDNDKAVKWLKNGAQPTERVEKILSASGALEAFKAAKGN